MRGLRYSSTDKKSCCPSLSEHRSNLGARHCTIAACRAQLLRHVRCRSGGGRCPLQAPGAGCWCGRPGRSSQVPVDSVHSPLHHIVHGLPEAHGLPGSAGGPLRVLGEVAQAHVDRLALPRHALHCGERPQPLCIRLLRVKGSQPGSDRGLTLGRVTASLSIAQLQHWKRRACYVCTSPSAPCATSASGWPQNTQAMKASCFSSKAPGDGYADVTAEGSGAALWQVLQYFKRRRSLGL